jgi:hypothetical protein
MNRIWPDAGSPGISPYVAGLHQPPMSLSVASAQSASTATTAPTITAFHIAGSNPLKPRIHGEPPARVRAQRSPTPGKPSPGQAQTPRQPRSGFPGSPRSRSGASHFDTGGPRETDGTEHVRAPPSYSLFGLYLIFDETGSCYWAPNLGLPPQRSSGLGASFLHASTEGCGPRSSQMMWAPKSASRRSRAMGPNLPLTAVTHIE